MKLIRVDGDSPLYIVYSLFCCFIGSLMTKMKTMPGILKRSGEMALANF